MSHLMSGLWCDLGRHPILNGEWWQIRVNGRDGHCCAKCKEEYEARSQATAAEAETRPNTTKEMK